MRSSVCTPCIQLHGLIHVVNTDKLIESYFYVGSMNYAHPVFCVVFDPIRRRHLKGGRQVGQVVDVPELQAAGLRGALHRQQPPVPQLSGDSGLHLRVLAHQVPAPPEQPAAVQGRCWWGPTRAATLPGPGRQQ